MGRKPLDAPRRSAAPTHATTVPSLCWFLSLVTPSYKKKMWQSSQPSGLDTDLAPNPGPPEGEWASSNAFSGFNKSHGNDFFPPGTQRSWCFQWSLSGKKGVKREKDPCCMSFCGSRAFTSIFFHRDDVQTPSKGNRQMVRLRWRYFLATVLPKGQDEFYPLSSCPILSRMSNWAKLIKSNLASGQNQPWVNDLVQWWCPGWGAALKTCTTAGRGGSSL